MRIPDMLLDKTHLEPYVYDFGARVTQCPSNTIELLENSCRPTTYSTQYEPLPNDLPQRRRRATPIQQFTNIENTAFEFTFADPAVFKAHHIWSIERILVDGPQTNVELSPQARYDPPVEHFPPLFTVSVQTFNVQKPTPQEFKQGSQKVTVPGNTTIETYVEAFWALVELPIGVWYRVEGRTKFRGKTGKSTITTRFYGMGEMMRLFTPNVRIVDDNAVDVWCGGRYSGELFLRWNTVARPIGGPLATSDDFEVTIAE